MILFTRLLTVFSITSLFALLVYAPWTWILASYIYYKIVVGLFGNQISQHRYFSHNSFETTRVKKYFLYFISLSTGVSPMVYALTHRHHHVHSDTEKDIHSWSNSFKDIFSPLTLVSTYKGPIKVARVLDKELTVFYRWHIHFILAIVVILSLINWKLSVYIFLAGIGWNYLHMILFRVFLVHYKLPGSYKNFDTSDNSWNNILIQILDFGEGLHNNHHAFPNRYDQAMKQGEFDPAGWLVKKLFAH